jgi:hypothetical protein
MTVSVTLFIIALSGIGILILSKLIERRIGKFFFLPQWMHAKDEMLEQTTRYLAQKGMWWVTHRARAGLVAGKERSARLIREVRTGEMARLRGTLKKNGSASVYLKQMVEHKQTLRNDGE